MTLTLNNNEQFYLIFEYILLFKLFVGNKYDMH